MRSERISGMTRSLSVLNGKFRLDRLKSLAESASKQKKEAGLLSLHRHYHALRPFGGRFSHQGSHTRNAVGKLYSRLCVLHFHTIHSLFWLEEKPCLYSPLTSIIKATVVNTPTVSIGTTGTASSDRLSGQGEHHILCMVRTSLIYLPAFVFYAPRTPFRLMILSRL